MTRIEVLEAKIRDIDERIIIRDFHLNATTKTADRDITNKTFREGQKINERSMAVSRVNSIYESRVDEWRLMRKAGKADLAVLDMLSTGIVVAKISAVFSLTSNRIHQIKSKLHRRLRKDLGLTDRAIKGVLHPRKYCSKGSHYSSEGANFENVELLCEWLDNVINVRIASESVYGKWVCD